MNSSSPPTSLGDASRAGQWLAMAICLFFGSLQVIMPLYDEVYWLNLVAISAVSIYTLLRCVFTPVTVSIWDYFAGMVGVLYGLGTLNTQLSGINSYRDLSLLTSAPVIYIHETMGYVSVLVGILLLVSLLTKARLFEGLTPDKLNASGLLFFGSCTALICVVLVAIGTIGYHGDVKIDDSITPSALATYAIFCLTPAAAALVFMWQRYTHKSKFIAAISLCAFLAVSLYLGRRNIIYTGFICCMAYFAACRNDRIFTRQSTIAIISALVLLPIITTGFMAMRLASYETAEKDKKPSVGKIVTTAVEIILRDKGEVDRQSAENLKDRTYLIGYLAELNWKTDIMRPLGGELFVFNLEMTIPNALWLEKFKYVRFGSEEALAHPLLGMPAWDASNSVLTTGMTDFGLIGMLLYPIGVVAFYGLFLRQTQRLNINIYFLMIFAFLVNLANIEGQMSAYFGFLRDSLLFSSALLFTIKFSQFFKNYNKPSTTASIRSRPNQQKRLKIIPSNWVNNKLTNNNKLRDAN